jgi:hypothetical protein
VKIKVMKTKATMILILFISITGYSQLIYEGTFNDRFKTIQLDNGEIKFLKYNKEEQLVYIYNLDQTEWKKVLIPLPEEHILDEIKSVTQTTFNRDTMIEMIYSCVEFTRNENSENTILGTIEAQFTLNIINEKGEMILKVPDSNEMEILDTNGKKKLLIYKHIGRGIDDTGKTLVYSLSEK